MPVVLAEPPAIDPAAPMIARTETIVIDRPPQAVRDWVVSGPLEAMVLPTGGCRASRA